MFDRRALGDELEAVRAEHAPGAIVLDSARDFETLDPAVAESLGPLVDGLDPVSHPERWLPDDAPAELFEFATTEFVIGMPGDGGVAWTTQTLPPTVIVKPRLQGSPDSFVRFLIAEGLVEAGLDVPEQFLEFFEARYRELAAVAPLDSGDTYQLAVALYDAHVGLQTRRVYREWSGEYPDLHRAWEEAGAHLEPRLADLPRELATGRTSFATAAEIACNAVKHDTELPAPFAALDTAAYREHGARFAVRWAERTFDALDANAGGDGER